MGARQYTPAWSEEYRGYTITVGEPQYGKSFAYKYTRDDGEHCYFTATVEEAKEEIDELLS